MSGPVFLLGELKFVSIDGDVMILSHKFTKFDFKIQAFKCFKYLVRGFIKCTLSLFFENYLVIVYYSVIFAEKKEYF